MLLRTSGVAAAESALRRLPMSNARLSRTIARWGDPPRGVQPQPRAIGRPRFLALQSSAALQPQAGGKSPKEKKMIENDVHLADIYAGLREIATPFPVVADQIAVQKSPQEFYDALIAGIKSAKTKISIASLYLGTGRLEQQLVEALQQALQSHPELQVQILLDFSRGQRKSPKSSVDMLLPLCEAFPSRFSLRLFRAPILRGIFKSLPSPWNETLGVLHLKAYVFDDRLIMSGANLSEDYFTDRQDRSISIGKAASLADYYHDIVKAVGQHSHEVRWQQGEMKLVNHEKPLAAMKQDLTTFCKNDARSTGIDAVSDTWAFPTVQMSPVALQHDHLVTKYILSHFKNGWITTIASGYLNFPEYFVRDLIECKSLVKVITASPKANGFYVAKGIKGSVPMAYTLIEKAFLKACKDRSSSIELYEYEREGWTFHGKGIWACPPGDTNPALISIGSPNFGKRSHEKDLESQIFIVTENDDLRARLHEEQQYLETYCTRVTLETFETEERRLKGFGWRQGVWIATVSGIMASFF